MTVVGTATVELLGDASGFNRELDKAAQNMQAVGARLQSIGKRLTLGVTLPIAGVGAAATINATKIDSLERSLAAVSTTGGTVADQMARLRRVAELPGLGFEEAIEGSVNLQAVGFEAEKAERTLMAFGNAVAATGGGRSELNRVITQLTQMASAGRILTADLRPIIQTSPLVARALQEAFGTIDAQQIESLGLTFDEFFERLVSQLEKMPKVTSGPAIAFENLADSVTVSTSVFGERFLPVVMAVSNGLATLLEFLASLNPVTQNFIIGLSAAAAALGPVAVVVGTIIKLLPVLQANMGLIVAAGGPVLAGVAAFGALVAAGLALVQNWGVIKFEVQSLVRSIREWLVDKFGGIVSAVGEKVDMVAGFFKDLKDKVVGNSFVPDMVDGIASEFTRMGGIMSRGLDAVVAFATGSENALSNFAESAAKSLAKLGIKAALSAIPGIGPLLGGITPFAHGGRFHAGQGMLVGERGPEIIQPSFSGQVIPNNDLGGGASAGAIAGEILAAVGPPPGNAPPSTIETDAWWREVHRRLARGHAERT